MGLSLTMSFTQYETQGIIVLLQPTPGKTSTLQFVRKDTGRVLLEVELPFNTELKGLDLQ